MESDKQVIEEEDVFDSVDDSSDVQYPYDDLDNMNVQVIGRIRPQTASNGAPLHQEGTNKIAARAGGPYFGFHSLHSQSHTTYDVFKNSVQSSVDIFLGGCNTCLLIGGESGSGKSFSMAGDGKSKAGLVPMIIDHLFTRLAKESHNPDKKLSLSNPRITMQMFEIYNELIKDLMQIPSRGSSGYLEVTEDALKGVQVRNISEVFVKDGTKANDQFRQAWGRRTEASTDYGPSVHNAAIVCHLDLEVGFGLSHRKIISTSHVGYNPQPYRSRYTVVELPGFEKLLSDSGYLSLREGPSVSQGLVAINQVVTSLASQPNPDRVIKSYSDSKLTQVLQEQLGGNCHTKALICLKPESDQDIVTAVLKFCNTLSQVKNFPVVNDYLAQSLLTQDRAKLIDLKHQAGGGPAMAASAPFVGDPATEVRRLQTENLVLKDQNERLTLRVDSLNNKFGHVAHTKTDLSQQLLLSEEEKLKVSQSLVEMQIENNKIKEDAEATNFEITNKIILLENQLVEAQNERDRHIRAAKATKERLNEMEADRKEIADEYVVLKTNYLALSNEHRKECTKNENLAIELLNLVNNKAALMRQVMILTNADPTAIDDPNTEIARVKALVNKNTSGKIKADQILGSQQDREQVEERLFASQRKFDNEINRLKHEYKGENKKYETQMNGIMKELAETRNLARERQQKISELNAKLITLRGEKEHLDTQTNRLQHKVKDLGDDFRARLVKYVEDIAEYVDKGSGVPGQEHSRRMREYSDNMLKDIRRSHKEREDQLSQAAQTFRKRVSNTVHHYEQVLIAYRNLRQTCEARGFDRADLGPDENELKLSDTEIQSSHLKELDRYKGELGSVKTELDAIKLRYGLFGDKENFSDLNSISAKSDLWGALRKQLREFTLNTQQNLEQERARLLSENQVLSQQLKESQEYIDSHLVRYKQEILRLRKLLGMSEAEASYFKDRPGKGKRK